MIPAASIPAPIGRAKTENVTNARASPFPLSSPKLRIAGVQVVPRGVCVEIGGLRESRIRNRGGGEKRSEQEEATRKARHAATVDHAPGDALIGPRREKRAMCTGPSSTFLPGSGP